MNKNAFTIRPSQKTADTINLLAKEMGVTKNKLISSFLEQAHPHMEEMLSALQLLNDRNPEGFSGISKVLKDVVSEASNSQSDIVDLMAKRRSKKGTNS